VTFNGFSHPSGIVTRLEAIENDLALRQNTLESAARAWFLAKRDKEHAEAVAFISAEGAMPLRKALAARETSFIGKTEEAEYEAVRAVTRVLETRATIGMALLKSQGRA
jgi:hypothetical protein